MQTEKTDEVTVQSLLNFKKSIMYHQVGEYRMNVFIQSMVSSDENYSKTT